MEASKGHNPGSNACAASSSKRTHPLSLHTCHCLPCPRCSITPHRLEQQYSLQYIKGSGDKCYTNPFIGTRLLEFGTSATLALVQAGTRLAAAAEAAWMS